MEDLFETPLYAIVGRRPVKAETDPKTGNLIIYAYNWEDETFFPTMEYLDRLYLGNGYEVEFISKQEFEEYVETLEKERLKKSNS